MSLVWTARPAEEELSLGGQAATVQSTVSDRKTAWGLWSIYIQVFLYLQVLDLLTTLIGLKLGIAEASPFVRALLPFGPAVAVTASKIVALGLGATCFVLKRSRLIPWVNCWYGLVVVWNLCTILTV